MRALLVCASPTPGSAELVARTAPGFDLVIAVDGGADICREAGVVPDMLVGDLDSASGETVDLLLSSGVTVHRFPAEKDASDLELAVAEARPAGARAITVTAATGGRLDHTLGTLAVLASNADLQPALLEPDMNGWVLSANAQADARFVGVGAALSLIAWGGTASVSVRGVRWPLDRERLSASTTLGISNVITAEEGATVSVDDGCVFVLSERGRTAPAIRKR